MSIINVIIYTVIIANKDEVSDAIAVASIIHHPFGSSHHKTACLISTMKEYKNIIIMSGKDYSEGIISAYWSVHQSFSANVKLLEISNSTVLNSII